MQRKVFRKRNSRYSIFPSIFPLLQNIHNVTEKHCNILSNFKHKYKQKHALNLLLKVNSLITGEIYADNDTERSGRKSLYYVTLNTKNLITWNKNLTLT